VNLPYQSNKLFLYIVCTIVVTVDRTLRTRLPVLLFHPNTGYDVFNSVIRWHTAPSFNWIPGLY